MRRYNMPSTVISELIHYNFVKEYYNFSLQKWEEIPPRYEIHGRVHNARFLSKILE